MAKYAAPARGKFGRLPPASPDITSTLTSIARDMQDKRISDMISAWKNGGLYDGKQVTDQDILKMWSDLLQGISQKDPNYWYYKEQAQQYEFSIAESKVNLAYKQGKMTDNQVAGFYLNWAKKVNPNTEFYRTIMGQAASFTKAAKAARSARASSSRAAAYANQMNSLYGSSTSQAAKYAQSIETALAKSLDLVHGQQTATDLSSTADATTLDQAMWMLSHGTYPDPVLRQAWQGWMDTLRTLDPSFNGNFSAEYLDGLLKKYGDTLQTAYNLAQSTGHKGDANTVSKAMAANTKQRQQNGAMSAAEQYETYRKQYQAVMDDPSATPSERAAASNTYANELNEAMTTLLKSDPTDPETLRIIHQLENEQKAVTGDPSADLTISTWAQDFSGDKSSDAKSPEATATGSTPGGWNLTDLYNRATQDRSQVAAVASGAKVWTQGTYDSKGVFTPKAGGPSIGAADAASVAPGGNSAIVAVPQSDGSTIPVVIPFSDLTLHVVDQYGKTVPLQHEAVAPAGTQGATSVWQAAPDPWGAGLNPGIATITIGGTSFHIYSYATQDPDTGKMVTRYSSTPPWNAGELQPDGKGGYELTGTVAPGASGVHTDPKTGTVVGFDPVQSGLMGGNGHDSGDGLHSPFVAMWASALQAGAISPKADITAATPEIVRTAQSAWLQSHPGDTAGAVAAGQSAMQATQYDTSFSPYSSTLLHASTVQAARNAMQAAGVGASLAGASGPAGLQDINLGGRPTRSGQYAPGTHPTIQIGPTIKVPDMPPGLGGTGPYGATTDFRQTGASWTYPTPYQNAAPDPNAALRDSRAPTPAAPAPDITPQRQAASGRGPGTSAPTPNAPPTPAPAPTPTPVPPIINPDTINPAQPSMRPGQRAQPV